ncbi:hypothetical protein ACFQGE_18385 [Halomicroarcula sp. GCM10025817]|uniref:hypothetical protein n=1 Tax=Haloarcula TaxID=2237 RepID=UPI0023E7CBC7|nr:hypothetical protein [Halomicroarcula sp. SYNS111]
MTDGDGERESVVFTYVAPFAGVLLVAIGIGAAVPGGYAILEGPVLNCGEPTIAVEGPDATTERFGEEGPNLRQFQFEDLSPAEQAAFREALTAPRNEAHVSGEFPNAAAFRNGSLVAYEGERHYVTTVSENPCFRAAPLQFPLGVFAIGLGVVMILTPPIYQRLVALDRRAR